MPLEQLAHKVQLALQEQTEQLDPLVLPEPLELPVLWDVQIQIILLNLMVQLPLVL